MIVKVDDIGDTTEISREVFSTGSFFISEMDRFDDFDGALLFFCPDLLHNDIVIDFAKVITGSEVTIKHVEFINKNYKCLARLNSSILYLKLCLFINI